MLSKLVYLTVLALIAISAIALPTDNHYVDIQTDDVELLKKTNLSSLFKFLDSKESRVLSQDGTGLKLRGIHFHRSPLDSRDLAETHISTGGALVARDDPTALCKPRCFDGASPVAYEWSKPEQPLALRHAICPWAADHMNNLNGYHSVIYYYNARCNKNIRPCNLITGVHIWSQASSNKNYYTLLDHCDAAMVSVVNDCGNFGGSTDCKISTDGGKTSLGDGAGYWTFFLQMSDDIKDPCDDPAEWGGRYQCLKFPCMGIGGFCDGRGAK